LILSFDLLFYFYNDMNKKKRQFVSLAQIYDTFWRAEFDSLHGDKKKAGIISSGP